MDRLRFRRAVIIVFAIFVLGLTSTAQTVATGTPAFGSFAGEINLGNLNAHYGFPIFSKSGRGLPFNYALTYDSSVWTVVNSSGQKSWQPVFNWGWQSNYAANSGYISNSGPITAYCYGSNGYPSGATTTISNWAYHDQWGIVHFFNGQIVSSTCPGVTNIPSFSSTTNDASGLTLNAPGNPYSILTPGGTGLNPPSGPDTAGSTITDSNGNQISSNSSGVFTDTLNTGVLTVAGSVPNPVTFTYTDSNGASQKVTVNYAQKTVQTYFGCTSPAIGEYGPTAVYLVSSLVYPDGTSYQFSYEPTLNGSGNVTGRIAQITLPTGGTIKYTYTGGDGIHNPINCADGSALNLMRRTVNYNGSNEDSTYTRSGSGTTWTTTVHPPDGNETSIAFQTVGTAFYETQRTSYVGAVGGTAIGSLQTCYNGSTVATPCDTPTIVEPISRRTVYPTLANGYKSETDTYYSAYGVPAEVNEYDFGSGAPGTRLRKTVTSLAVLGGYLYNRPASTTVYDSGDNVQAQVSYQYDQTAVTATGAPQHVAVSAPRGNPTTITNLLTGGTNPSTTLAYDDTGNVISSTDPGGHITGLSYSTTFASAYLTQVTLPSTGVSHTASANYDINTGLKISDTDQNNQISSYTYDSMLRLTKVTRPDTGHTDYTYSSYNGNLYSQAQDYMDTSKNVNHWILYDGYGRPSTSFLVNGEGNDDQQDTCYDNMGRVSFVSYPHRDSGLGSAKICSGAGDSYSYSYSNGTGSPSGTAIATITHSDGNSAKRESYGRATRTTDEGNGSVGVQKIAQVDGLGRTIYLCEVTGATQQGSGGSPADCALDMSGTGFRTDYDYDTLGNLRHSYQGTITPHTRTFNYDSLSRLTSSKVPEMQVCSGGTCTSGTTSFNYDADGNVLTRVRPAPNQTGTATVTTNYGYDALHRLTTTSYTDGTTPPVSRYYDESSIYGATLTNTVGRLSRDVVNNSSTAYNLYTYDAIGRVLGNWQDTPVLNGSSKYLPYTYDLLGNLATFGNGAGVVFSNGYNQASRLTGITNTNYVDTNHPAALLSGVTYNAFGAPLTATLGNGVTDSIGYATRGWMQTLTSTGNVAAPATAGSGSLTITGAERMNGSAATVATGSVTFSGTEQSTQVLNQAAAAGSGSFTVTGSEQSKQVLTTAAVSGTGSVTISGSERTKQVAYQCGQYSTCYYTVPDTGTVSITVNGLTKSISYGNGDTSATLASALASAFNGDSTSAVTASASGGTVTFTAKTTGAATNYSLSASSVTTNASNFSSTSFPVSTSGSALTGGADAVYSTVYDSGIVTSTVYGFSAQVSYGQGSTASGLATALASSFNVASSPVNASASGGTVSVTAKATGAVTNYAMSASATYNSSQFASPSFADSASGGALTGGRDATYNTIYDSGTVSITANTHVNSVTYSQGGNSTPTTIASAMAANINADIGAYVTASASGTTVYLTSKVNGSAANYSLSATTSTSQGTYFSSPSFSGSASGASLTGGQNGGAGTPTYDVGTYSITVGTYPSKSTDYGQYSTPATIASTLAGAFANDASSPVTATATSATITFTAKTNGSATNYAFSTSSASTQTGFTGSSFSSTPVSGSLSGGSNSSTAPGTVYSFALGFHPDGNINTANDNNLNGNWTYGYDDLNRLASAGKTGQAFTYGYDRYGNRTNQTVTAGIGTSPTFSFTNNQIDGYCYDAAGNLLREGACGSNTYTYDAENRMISAPNTTYFYDADGRRIRKTVSGVNHDFLYDLGGRVVAELDGSGTVVRTEIFAGARHLATFAADSKTYFNHSDWQGTERVRTNMSGTLAESFTSWPFGDGLSSSGTASPNHFTGDEHDTESNLEHTSFRQLSTTQGRWTSPDPLGGNIGDPQSLNRYAYVQNNPVNYFDPLGLDLELIGDCYWDIGWTQTGADGVMGPKIPYKDFIGCGFGRPNRVPLFIEPSDGGGDDTGVEVKPGKTHDSAAFFICCKKNKFGVCEGPQANVTTGNSGADYWHTQCQQEHERQHITDLQGGMVPGSENFCASEKNGTPVLIPTSSQNQVECSGYKRQQQCLLKGPQPWLQGDLKFVQNQIDKYCGGGGK
jgi:RHS repeat-associated protein